MGEKQEVQLQLKNVTLPAFLTPVENSKGLVIFAHGTGSSRFSSRNNFVAEVLNEAGLSTLLFDLLTEKEDEVYENRFDINLITSRLVEVTEWVEDQEKLNELNLGYFGSSTGAAAALKAAVKKEVSAVVSRGGRVDLAQEDITKVESPTLMIVGGADTTVKQLNKKTAEKMNCEYKMEIIPGAGHLFEDEDELQQVAELARSWFLDYLS